MRKVNKKGLEKIFNKLKIKGQGYESVEYNGYIIHIKRNTPLTGSERVQSYYKRHPEKKDEINQRKRAKYFDLKEAGNCPKCGKQNKSKFILCEECRK